MKLKIFTLLLLTFCITKPTRNAKKNGPIHSIILEWFGGEVYESFRQREETSIHGRKIQITEFKPCHGANPLPFDMKIALIQAVLQLPCLPRRSATSLNASVESLKKAYTYECVENITSPKKGPILVRRFYPYYKDDLGETKKTLTR